MADIGHNNPPRDRSFKKRWAFAVFDHPTKPAGAVALAFKLYMEMDSNGKGAVISDREFVEATGCSERSCQNFKRWLIEEEFIHIHVKGARGRANEFVAHIPEGMTAIDATSPKQPSAPITGKVENERQPLPIVKAGMAAIDADNRALSATVADSAKNLPCAPAHAEENNNIYNNYNNLPPKTAQQPAVQGSVREELDNLYSVLRGACNGALAPEVNSLGLIDVSVPRMWLSEGADLELDILPTLRGIGAKRHGENISTWKYFTKAVAEAKAYREAGLPPVKVGRVPAKESNNEKLSRRFKAAETEKGGG